MTFLALIALAFGAFCMMFSAYDNVSRRGKADIVDVIMEFIFGAGGLCTLATSLKVLIS